MAKGVVTADINSVHWQDFRGINCGIIVNYETDSVSELPVREIPEEYPTEVIPEPNYETASYGVYGCKNSKVRNGIAKKKFKYVLFMSKYAGVSIDHADELFVTGFYRIKQTADLQKTHMRYLADYSCLGEDRCIAFRADEVVFVKIADALKVTPALLTKWGVVSRVTRQSRIELSEEHTMEVLEFLRSKDNALAAYIEETKHLSPDLDEDEDEDDDE